MKICQVIALSFIAVLSATSAGHAATITGTGDSKASAYNDAMSRAGTHCRIVDSSKQRPIVEDKIWDKDRFDRWVVAITFVCR